MKPNRFLLPFLACAISLSLPASHGASTPTPDEVKAITQKVADWQIATFADMGAYRALPGRMVTESNNIKPYHDLNWHCGALYAGMNQWRTIADNSTTYNDWLAMIGRRNGWKLHQRPYHADDHAVGQFYLSFYENFQDPAMLAPTKDHFDWILANPRTGTLEWIAEPTDAHHRWGWCDALFMAPPVWTRLAKITGDQKYLDFMNQEYHATYDLLWDQQEKLFWRDSSFFKKREANGKKVFWARGNGWVFGGLALMIPDMPENWEGRAFYIDLYKTMAARLKELQRKDGTWSMGLLGGEDGYPIVETSGTSFFTFGLAWGVNNGFLDRASYMPVILKSWNALTACVREDGLLGHVQPVGAAPGDSYPDKSEVYGVGAFLAAGTEVYKLLGGVVNPAKPVLNPLPTSLPSESTEQTFNAATKAQTFARFVPERMDDFAWENDRIAFRAYGPALREGAENSGIDCWLKRVPYPVINKWYAGNKQGKSYHKDHGEGLDNYHVGSSAGTGGTGIWLNGKREPLETYVKYELIESKPERSEFKLIYEREIDGVFYGEEKTIMIEPGKRLFQAFCVFTKDGKPASNLPICIGVTTHDGKAEAFFNKEHGWIAAWEVLDNSELGTAVKMSPSNISEIKIVNSKINDESHILILAKTDSNGKLNYEAGYGWKKAGGITTRKEWEEYLNQFE